jgi:hypothetical protein
MKKIAIGSLVGLVLGCLVLGTATVRAGDKEKQDEQKVTLDQLPAVVKEALVKAADGGVIKEIEKEVEKGKTVYEAEVVKDGKKTEIKVDETGRVLKIEADDDDDDDDGGKPAAKQPAAPAKD